MSLRFTIASISALVPVPFVAQLAFGAQGTPVPATPAPEAGIPPVVWQLTAITLADGTESVPDDPAKYTVQFLADGTVRVVADCNAGSGPYTLDGASLTIGPVATTRVACSDGSLSDELVTRLGDVDSFAYEEDALVLTLADDAGTLRLVPTLIGVVWTWRSFEGGDGSVITPDDPTEYTLQFLPEGAVTVRADCNRGVGSYTADGAALDMARIALTRAACPPGSLADGWVQDLDEVVSYVFRNGDLYLALPADAGILAFAALAVDEVPATPAAG